MWEKPQFESNLTSFQFQPLHNAGSARALFGPEKTREIDDLSQWALKSKVVKSQK